jgi:hypothetical protein
MTAVVAALAALADIRITETHIGRLQPGHAADDSMQQQDL